MPTLVKWGAYLGGQLCRFHEVGTKLGDRGLKTADV